MAFRVFEVGTINPSVDIVLFFSFVTAGALAGYALLILSGLDDCEAWALGRLVGPAVVVLPAWWAGALGLSAWPVVGAAALVIGGSAGVILVVRRRPWRGVLGAEAVFLGGFLAVFLMRLGRPAILQTEKLMDLGILSTLLRTQTFPPPDMWLAGESLPYYYWGSLVWALPMRLSGLAPEWGFNLVVALVGGVTTVVIWSLGARLAGGRWACGATAAFFALFAGTADGLRQLLGGAQIRYLDLWASSRQVPDTITEFPLFSFWLGDLHPHLLSLPLSLAAIALAAAAGREKLKFPLAALSSILFGLTWAANPWALPPTFLAIALMLVAGDGRWRWPDREGWPRWVTALAVGAGGWLIAAPFHLAFDPPSRSVRTVFAWTRPTDLLLFAGVLLVPAFFVVVRLMQRWGGPNGLRAQAFAAGVGALTVVGAAATGRPSMVFLCVGVAVLVAAVLEQGDDSDRPALALAALALFLFLVPEMLYLEDGYGEKMHRMNTVFKAYFQGWVLLAAAMPVLVRLGGGSRRGRSVLLALSVAVALPHLLSVGLGAWASPSRGLDGLAWMDEGDRSIVEELRRQAPGVSFVEAVGDAYSEYARLSSASGVPTYLGWANHELVWRGPGVLNETGRRQDVIHSLYSLGDPLEVASLAQENDIGLIAIGSLERRDYCESELDAVREAGVEIIDCGSGGELVVMVEKENLS